MKTILKGLLILFIFSGYACNSAKKAEAERKRVEKKMEELDKNKQQFELRNPR